MNKTLCFGLVIIISLSSITSVNSNELSYQNFNSKFDLSGKLIQEDAQEFPLNGELDLNVLANTTFIEYNLEYFALIPSLFDTYGSASYSENITSKELSQENLNSTALDVVWTIFTNGISNVQSIFRLTENEIQNGMANLLNYTDLELVSRIFQSPQLGSNINSYYVEFDLEAISYQIYYDAKNLVLIGLNVFITSEALNYDFDVALRADIKHSSLDLDRAGEIEELNTLIFVGASMAAVIFIAVSIWYVRRSKTIISGGL